MSVSTIDNSVRKTHEWLQELRGIGGFEDEAQAYSALRASLQTLRDRLTPGEAADLGSELPMVIRGLYFEGWKPTAPQSKERSWEDFMAKVRERMRGGTAVDPESAAKGHVSASGVPDLGWGNAVREIDATRRDPQRALAKRRDRSLIRRQP